MAKPKIAPPLQTIEFFFKFWNKWIESWTYYPVITKWTEDKKKLVGRIEIVFF
jgi:hypothetical protein